MNCTVLSKVLYLSAADKGDPCVADGGDICKADDGKQLKLATARSRTPQLPPRFCEASHAAKTFFLLAVSLLKVKELQLHPVSL